MNKFTFFIIVLLVISSIGLFSFSVAGNFTGTIYNVVSFYDVIYSHTIVPITQVFDFFGIRLAGENIDTSCFVRLDSESNYYPSDDQIISYYQRARYAVRCPYDSLDFYDGNSNAHAIPTSFKYVVDDDNVYHYFDENGIYLCTSVGKRGSSSFFRDNNFNRSYFNSRLNICQLIYTGPGDFSYTPTYSIVSKRNGLYLIWRDASLGGKF